MRLRALAAISVISGCATLAGEAGDLDAVRPNAAAGPFRALTRDELDTTKPPAVLRQKAAEYGEAGVLALDATAFGSTALYVAATLPAGPGIYRFVAPDARSFLQPDPATPVLAVSAAWEGGAVGGPNVVRRGDEVWIYYSGAGGIGLARSPDGITFEKHDGPVLDANGASAWEGGDAPASPAFLELAADDLRLFYEAGSRIGEARSSDGVVWERLGEPVLEPAPPAGDEEPFDSVAVGDPEATLARSAEGRRIVRVYYAGSDSQGGSSIGLAARYAADGPLQRAPVPAFASVRNPFGPALVRWEGLSLLFFTQRAGSSPSDDYPAVGVAVAPATTRLPPPTP